MNCADCQRICLENGGRNLPAECTAHMAGCESCRKAGEGAAVVAKLLALKKYEQPDPMFAIRNAAAIRKRISEEESPMFDWLTGILRPWSALAACAVIAGIAVLVHFNRPQTGTGTVAGEPAAAAPAIPESAQPQPDPADPAWFKPMFVIQDNSGAPPQFGQPQFGESNNLSRPVDFTAPGPLR